MKRKHALPATLIAAVLAPLALAASPAAASFVHSVQTASFGVDGTSGSSFSNQIRAVSVDSNSHHVYVEDDSGTPRIYAFDATSDPTPYAPLSGNFPIAVGAGGFYAGLSVDNASGKLYYSTTGNGTVSGFDSTGAALGGGFPIDPTYPAGVSEYICGVAVDSGGNIWVGNYYSTSILKHSSGGAFAGIADATASSNPCRLAFDQSNGDLYIGQYNGGVRRYPFVNGGYNQSTVISNGSATGVAVDSSSHTIYVAQSNAVSAYAPDGTRLEEFATGIGGSWAGVAVDSTSGDVYLADANGGGKVRVFPGINVPDATTGEISDLTRTSATLHGHVDPSGAGDVVDCHFDYGTNTSYGLGSAGCLDDSDVLVGTAGNPITTPTDVDADLSGLAADTNHHYRLVAANAAYPHPGEDATFETPIAVGGVTTDAATSITKFSATLNGAYNGDGGEIQFYFEYGPDTKYGNTTATPPGAGNGTATGLQNVSASIAGLVANGTYHFRLVAHNAFGYNYGADQVIVTTPPDLPVVASTYASPVTEDSATLNTSINPGSGPTVYRFQYGPTPAYGSQTYPGGPTPADDQFHSASTGISGLAPGTTYHFRVRATNFAGSTVGPDQTFTTPGPPVFGSFTASAITQTSAILGAQVNPGLNPTSYHFDYGPSDAYGSRTLESPLAGADSSEHPAAAAISGLTPGTTYHFRAVATNSLSTTSGPDQTFTTALPAIVRPPAKCKAGFVKKRDRCVKKKRHKKRHHRNKRNEGRRG